MGGNRSPHEDEVQMALESRGWGVLRKGWPDILAFHPSGSVKVIEVKANKDPLRPEQQDVIAILRSIGVDVEVWRRHSDGHWCSEHESSPARPGVGEEGQEVAAGLLRADDYSDPGWLIDHGDLELLEACADVRSDGGWTA